MPAGIRHRDVYSPKAVAVDVDVCVEGVQFSDGRVTAHAALYFEDDATLQLNAANVRHLAPAILEGDLAAKLLAAADQLDMLATV